MIRLENLTKRFGAVDAVRGVSMDVPDRSLLVLVGPSGCGKSTILRMLAGLEAPSGGTISFNGAVVSDGDRGLIVDPARRNAGLVFQSYALWPHMTVAGNVDWPLKVAGWSRTARRDRVAEVTALLGVQDLAQRYPNEISGGQQQRVAIARMIAPRPAILLFDEPLSNLDAKLRVDMRTELLKVHRATGATSVYVTHDQVEAMTMATHVAVLNGGRVEQFGTPAELVASPCTAFVATFLGTPPANLVPLSQLREIVSPAAAGLAADGYAMYRPEELKVSREAAERSLRAEFVEASPVAGRLMITGILQSLRMTAVVDENPGLRLGETVYFVLPEVPAALFSKSGNRIG
jgi:iron(III) transport system ATP-binding protein